MTPQPTAHPEVDGFDPEDQISALEHLNTLLRHRYLVGGVAMGFGLLLLAVLLLWPRSYTTSASIMPSADNPNAGLAGVAAQFGLALPTQSADQSPDFYGALLTSDRVLRGLVDSAYNVPYQARDQVDLVAYFDYGSEERPVGLEKAMERLRRHLHVSTNLKTNMVTFDVDTRSAALSYAVAVRAIDLINTFDLEQRQSQAGAERRFLERRLADAAGQLKEAEDAMAGFLERNRNFSSSPQLMFQRDRLQRAVDIRQQVYTSLEQSYEKAKLDEIRNTPIISVVVPPVVAARPDPRRLAIKLSVGLALGLAVGVLLAYLRDAGNRAPARDPKTFREFERLRAEAARDLRRVFRRRSVETRTGGRKGLPS